MFVYSARNLRPPISRKSEEIGRGSAKCALLPVWARFLCVSCSSLNKGGRSLALDVAMICSNTWYSKLVLRGVTNAAGNYVVSKWHHLRHGSTRRGLHHRSSVSLPFMCREILNREFIAAPGSIKTHGLRSCNYCFLYSLQSHVWRKPFFNFRARFGVDSREEPWPLLTTAWFNSLRAVSRDGLWYLDENGRAGRPAASRTGRISIIRQLWADPGAASHINKITGNFVGSVSPIH